MPLALPVGGNVWLVESVPPRSKVTYQAHIARSHNEGDASGGLSDWVIVVSNGSTH